MSGVFDRRREHMIEVLLAPQVYRQIRPLYQIAPALKAAAVIYPSIHTYIHIKKWPVMKVCKV